MNAVSKPQYNVNCSRRSQPFNSATSAGGNSTASSAPLKVRSVGRGRSAGNSSNGGRWIINEGLSAERALSHAIGDIEPLAEGDTVTHYTPGGGGYGHPSARDPAAVQDDVRRGLVSLAAAERDYGVRLDAGTLEVVGLVR